MRLTVVDYGAGNVGALVRLSKLHGIECVVAQEPVHLAQAMAIVLPGVGTFDHVASALEASGMADALRARVESGVCRVLGICVGMQLLASSSEEGTAPGLGLIEGTVVRLDPSRIDRPAKVPHMGWNSIRVPRPHSLFGGLDEDKGFYFLHSYHFQAAHERDVIAWTTHGYDFPCAVESGGAIGVQFHPEKSHGNGAKLLRNFVRSAAC